MKWYGITIQYFDNEKPQVWYSSKNYDDILQIYEHYIKYHPPCQIIQLIDLSSAPVLLSNRQQEEIEEKAQRILTV